MRDDPLRNRIDFVGYEADADHEGHCRHPLRHRSRAGATPMTDRVRVAITLATGLLLGAFFYGQAVNVSPPGVLNDIWESAIFGFTVLGLAVFAVSLVYRWWALLPAIAPAAVYVYLYKFTDYDSPWSEDIWEGLSDDPLFALLVGLMIGLSAALLSVGLLLRAAWEWLDSGGSVGSLFGTR